MGLPNASSRSFKATPPDKGSFPLDHEGECKVSMKAFLTCLRSNENDSRKCRPEMKVYLECRMEKELMAREDWKKLGFSENDEAQSSTSS